MGWGNCGTDSRGRPIGYCHEATCDCPNCDKEIDRGLAYACGGMHGSDTYSCDGYFCGEHLWYVEIAENDDKKDTTLVHLCPECKEALEEELFYDEVDDIFYATEEGLNKIKEERGY